MSVIVESNKGEMWLLTKGAESSIIPKCTYGPCVETLMHVMEFALVNNLKPFLESGLIVLVLILCITRVGFHLSDGLANACGSQKKVNSE